MGCAALNSHSHHSIMLSVSSAHISTDTEAILNTCLDEDHQDMQNVYSYIDHNTN